MGSSNRIRLEKNQEEEGLRHDDNGEHNKGEERIEAPSCISDTSSTSDSDNVSDADSLPGASRQQQQQQGSAVDDAIARRRAELRRLQEKARDVRISNSSSSKNNTTRNTVSIPPPMQPAGVGRHRSDIFPSVPKGNTNGIETATSASATTTTSETTKIEAFASASTTTTTFRSNINNNNNKPNPNLPPETPLSGAVPPTPAVGRKLEFPSGQKQTTLPQSTHNSNSKRSRSKSPTTKVSPETKRTNRAKSVPPRRPPGPPPKPTTRTATGTTTTAIANNTISAANKNAIQAARRPDAEGSTHPNGVDEEERNRIEGDSKTDVIWGGAGGFYKRAEIRDCMCFLKWINNGNDDGSMMRCMKTPSKGIGEKTFTKFKAYCELVQKYFRQNCPDQDPPTCLDVLISMTDDMRGGDNSGSEGDSEFNTEYLLPEGAPLPLDHIAKRALTPLLKFSSKMSLIRSRAYTENIGKLLLFVIDELELIAHFDVISKSPTKFDERKENVQELRNAAKKYSSYGPSLGALSKQLPQKEDDDDDGIIGVESALSSFLDDFALVSDIAEANNENHVSKGTDRKPSAMSTPPPKKPRKVSFSPSEDDQRQGSACDVALPVAIAVAKAKNEGDDEVRTVLYWFAFFCSSSFLQNYSKILSFLPIMFSFVLFCNRRSRSLWANRSRPPNRSRMPPIKVSHIIGQPKK